MLVRHCPSSALQSCLPSAPTWCRSGGFGRSGLPVNDWKRCTTPLIQHRWLRVWHRLAVDYCADAWLFSTTIRRQQRWCFRQLRLMESCTLGRVQSLEPQRTTGVWKTQQRIHLHTARSTCLQLCMSVVRVV